ncbi:MAG: hypothetical protein U0903_15050 [Planctomycetales bacterium]
MENGLPSSYTIQNQPQDEALPQVREDRSDDGALQGLPQSPEVVQFTFCPKIKFGAISGGFLLRLCAAAQ